MRQAEIPLFLLDLIVASNPLFLPPAGSLAGGDSTVERVDMPAVPIRIVLDPGMREHREHELAFAVADIFFHLVDHLKNLTIHFLSLSFLLVLFIFFMNHIGDIIRNGLTYITAEICYFLYT